MSRMRLKIRARSEMRVIEPGIEPVRLQIQDAEDRVAASALRGDVEAHRFSQSMLRGSHLHLVMIEVGVVVALGLVILALNGRMIMPIMMSY